MVWGTWLLLSCKAENLRIHLAPTGLASLSQEDLERDIWQLEKEAGHDWYLDRMEKMGLTPFSSKDGLCVGKNTNRRVSVIRNGHSSLYISMAIQISLAKVQHGHEERYSFCVYDTAKDRDDWFLGDMGGMILQVEKNKIQTRIPNPDIHYPKLIEHTREIVTYISILSD